MMHSLFAGSSGMTNHQQKMNVIGNNIANASTAGFKGARVNFTETFARQLKSAQGAVGGYAGKNPLEVGMGVALGSIDTRFTQGGFEDTGIATDLAINGDGFFVTSNGSQTYYTRSGNFLVDQDGYLVSKNSRMFIQGRNADANGNIGSTAAISDIQLPIHEKLSAKSTTQVDYYCNLDRNASKTRASMANTAFTLNGNAATPDTDINNLDQVTTPLDAGDQITITGVDRDGNTVNTVYTYASGDTLSDLLKSINGTTGYNSANQSGSTASIDSTGKIVINDNMAGESQTELNLDFLDANGASAIDLPVFETKVDGKTGMHTAFSYVYDSLGEKHRMEVVFTQDVSTPNQWNYKVIVNDGAITPKEGETGSISFYNDGALKQINGGKVAFDIPGASGMVVDLDFGQSGNLSGVTQFSSPSTTIAINQDGYGMGVMESFEVNSNGLIMGKYSNGLERELGQVMLAKFANPQGLEKSENTMWKQSANSGNPIISEAGVNNEDSILSEKLENSNVDLTEEFTNMIIAQRAFQANARVVTTTDQILAEITQLKR